MERNGWRGRLRPPLHSAGPDNAQARRVLMVASIVAAMAAVGALALLIPQGDDDDVPPVNEGLTLPTVPEPSDTISLFPPAAGESVSIPGSATRTTEVATTLPTTTRPAPPTRTTSQNPPTAELTVGATVGFEVRRLPGFRVRHRNFLGRVDRISANSSAGDRADARFVVRRGLGSSACISLEAVNFPGFFLRHRNFVIHLERQDGTALFRDDATFCPADTGDAVVLKSINFPTQGIALQSDNTLHLDDDGITAFVVRPPL